MDDNAKRYNWCAIVLCIAMFAIYAYMIWSGMVDMRRGDPSSRYLHGLGIELDGSFFTGDFWFTLWPQLPFVIEKCLSQLFLFVGLPKASHLEQILTVSALIGSCSLYLIYRLGRELVSPISGLFAMLAVAAVPMFHGISTTTLGQIYAMPFILLGITHARRAYVDKYMPIAAGVFFLLGTMCRTEAICAAGAVSLAFLLSKRLKDFVTLGFISSIYFTIQQTGLYFTGGATYYTLNKTMYNKACYTVAQKADYLAKQMGQVFQTATTEYTWLVLSICIILFIVSIGFVVRRPGGVVVILAALALFFFVLAVQLSLSRGVGCHGRDYLLGLMLVMTCIGTAVGIVVEHFDKKGFKPTRYLAAGLLVCLLCLSVRAAVASSNWRKPPAHTIEVREWIQEHRKDGDTVLFDLIGWGHYLHARTTPPDDVHSSWAYAVHDRFPTSVLKLKATNRFERFSYNALDYLAQRRPKYVVTHNDRLHTKLSKNWNNEALHKAKPSYILHHFVDSESGDKIFDSPEFYDGYISLHLKYDNGIEAIYEVAYGDTVQVPNEHGKYPRDVTGKP